MKVTFKQFIRSTLAISIIMLAAIFYTEAHADGVVLLDATTIKVTSDHPTSPTIGRIRTDSWMVHCPASNSVTGEKLITGVTLLSAITIPTPPSTTSTNATFVYSIAGSGAQQMAAMTGSNLGVGKGITTMTGGYSKMVVNTYGSMNAKSSSYTVRCTGITTGTAVPMELMPTGNVTTSCTNGCFNVTKGHVLGQLKNNAAK